MSQNFNYLEETRFQIKFTLSEIKSDVRQRFSNALWD
jgi:hypothetical protein